MISIYSNGSSYPTPPSKGPEATYLGNYILEKANTKTFLGLVDMDSKLTLSSIWGPEAIWPLC